MNKGQPALRPIFQKTITRHSMFRAGDKVVVAVSGGPDSVALLHLLYELREVYPLKLCVAHFDHGLRGQESTQDALFVKDLARGFNLPFYKGQGDVYALKQKEGLSLEEAGRELRYKFLRDTAEKAGAQKVALGHTADDQVEEFLLRLIRGSGTRGLSGMPFTREGIFVRPLLEVSRTDILSYLIANKFSFRMDSSNNIRDFLRNRIRHELLPGLETNFNPRLRKVLLRTMSILRDDDALLTDMTQRASARLLKLVENPEGKSVLVDLRQYRDLPPPIQMRIIQKGLGLIGARLKDIGFNHLQSINNLAIKDGPYRVLSLPGQVAVERIYQELKFSCKDEIGKNSKDFSYKINGLGRYFLPEINRSISFEVIERLDSAIPIQAHQSSCFDYRQIFFPLVVRNFQPGDRFYPEGMGGSQKVKDYFINKKIPRPLRYKIPIIERQGKILGILGWRVDERFKVTEKTKQILRVWLD